MQVEFTSAEKVIFKYNKEFHLKNGDTEGAATEKAMNKIISVRALKKKIAKY
jgi:hypothetical protein